MGLETPPCDERDGFERRKSPQGAVQDSRLKTQDPPPRTQDSIASDGAVEGLEAAMNLIDGTEGMGGAVHIDRAGPPDGPLQIGPQILDMLQPHRQAHQLW